MDNNYSVKILDVYMNINKIHDLINNKLLYFINSASELVDLSEDMYQIEKTIKLNKISLKRYILDSPCCNLMKENNISNYSIDELKKFLTKYESSSNKDCSSYYLSIKLYELLEEIEELVDNKVKLEIERISELEPLINNVGIVKSNDYESIYNQIKLNLKNNYLLNNLIDDRVFNICVQFINDIFNYYINGYPDIPLEYV